MNTLLGLTLSGQALSFNSDGSVCDSSGNHTGAWTSQSASRTSGLVYTPIAGAAIALSTTLGFNSNNQLTVQVSGGTGVTPMMEAVAIEGFIYVEDNQDLVYYAIDNNDPNQPSFAFYLYGAMAIDPGANRLAIALPGAAVTLSILGQPASGASALATGMADGGLDQVQFNATTHNPLPSGSVDIPASILLNGMWDVKDGQLAFGVNYDTTSTPAMTVTVAASVKGVAAGFELYSQGPDPRLLLTLAGQIKGTNENGTWTLSIGYANRILTASAQVQDTVVTPAGTFVINGQFLVAKAGAAPLSMAIALQATWKLQNGQLALVVTGNTTGAYNLQLTGTLKVDGDWNVSFAAIAGASSSFKLSIGYAPPQSSLNAALSLYCANNQVQLSLNLSASLTWVDGHLVPTPSATGSTASSASPAKSTGS